MNEKPKFISLRGFATFITWLKNTLSGKVDKVNGKDLSTNDFTNEYKDKLDSVESSAEVNTIEAISVNGVTQTIDQNKNVNLEIIITDVDDTLTETGVAADAKATGDAIATVDLTDRIAKGGGTQSVKVGNISNLTASGKYSYAEGTGSRAIADYSHAQGFKTITNGNVSHAEGSYSETSEDAFYGHAEGYRTSSKIDAAHAEGLYSIAAGTGSHVEGGQIVGKPRDLYGYSFSLYLTGGANAKTYTYTGDMPFYVGHFVRLTTTNQLFKITAINTTNKTITFDDTLSSFAINNGQMYFLLASQATGTQTHAEGSGVAAFGDYSHVQGIGTIAKNKSQHVFGEYNEVDPSNNASTARGNYVEIVGKGSGATARSNARTLDWNGNEVLSGKLTVGANPTGDMDVATKKYVDEGLDSARAGMVLPALPSTDGSYILTVTISNGEPTYIWQVQS